MLKRRLSFEEIHLGTPVLVRLVTTISLKEAEFLVRRAFEEAQRIEDRYSRFLEDNVLFSLNSSLGRWFPVDEELYGLLCFAEHLRTRTAGAFDLSVKGLLEQWGYDARYNFNQVVNMPNGLSASKLLTGSFELRQVGATFEVKLSAPIELGGLGKGYAIDRMASILRTQGDVSGFCINAGGDLFVAGEDEEGADWKIVFEHPQDINLAIGEVFIGHTQGSCHGLALASSSPSRRHWKNGNKLRHHLVDPRTGEPANQMLAVYTQASEALVADAYSTALFVLGFDESKCLVPKLPLEAMLISPRGEIWRSEGFLGHLYRGE